MASTTQKWFVKGYQEALSDIALKLIADGEDGVINWLISNLQDNELARLVVEFYQAKLAAKDPVQETLENIASALFTRESDAVDYVVAHLENLNIANNLDNHHYGRRS